MMLQRIFVFILGCGLSYLLMRYRKQVHDFTGDVGFAEKYLGTGGTYTFYVLLGILIFIISLMYLFGTLDGFLGSTVGKIF